MADALINLVEFAKGMDDGVASAMIEQFASSSDILSTIPVKSVPQGLNVFDRETSEPTVAFRGLNAEPDISYGTEQRFQDICAPISGLVEFDRIKLQRYGEAKKALYMRGQMKNAARVWTDTFINGNSSLTPQKWDGLQRRLTAVGGSIDGSNDDSRLLANNTASGGGPLSMAKLDLAIDLTNEPSHILMPRKMRTRFKAAARDPNLTNNRVTDDMDSDIGRRVLRYGDIPILIGYEVSKGSSFLPFTEVAYGGGGAVTTSLYVVSLREDGVCAIQSGPPTYDPIQTDRGVFQRELFEWDNGITIEDYYSAIRLSSVTDAAIVA